MPVPDSLAAAVFAPAAVALARVSCGHTNNGSGCCALAGSPTYATCDCADRRAAGPPTLRPPEAAIQRSP
jgi:hypothetical protein